MRDQNTKAIGLMIGAMFVFAATDSIIKYVTTAVSPPQVMLFLIVGGAILFSVIAKQQNSLIWTKQAVAPVLLIRYLAEIAGLASMIMALSSLPLSTIGAIIQSIPLIVTFCAVIFLGERVSWRRWTAIIVGFIGVLMIMQPGMDGFDMSILWAILSALSMAVRDLTTRKAPHAISSSCLAAYSMYAALPFAVIWVAMLGEPFIIIEWQNWALLCSLSVFGALGYLLLIAATRTADLSVVSPYRYSRLLFMLVLGIAIFNEQPDMWVLLGAALIVASGIYIMWRERVLARGP